MIKIYAGENGQGKTLMLEKIKHEALNDEKDMVTNLTKFDYRGFNEDRLKIVISPKNIEEVFNYHEIIVANDRLTAIPDDGYEPNGYKVYTDAFLNLITLICRVGDILILDEPDFGLTVSETTAFIQILIQLKHTFKEIHIVTHCSRLFSLKEQGVYWIQNYKCILIEGEGIYEYIGKIRG